MYLLERTTQVIARLQEKRAHIDATLAELQFINDSARKQLEQR